MFASDHLARRIEAAEASLSREIGEATARRRGTQAAEIVVRQFAGGVAVCTGAESPITKIIGVGFEEVPLEVLEGIERAFAERGAAVRAEVATLADPAVHALLTRRGYVLQGFENVLGRRLEPGEAYSDFAGIDIAEVADQRAWTAVVIEGFEHPDTGVASAPGEVFPRDVVERIYDDMAEAAGFARYLARIGGTAVGGAAMRLSEGIAQLAGAATVPAARRRGVQTALLNRRLRDAARAGCDIAVVTTQPGSKSQENAQRRGFALLYARAVLVRSA